MRTTGNQNSGGRRARRPSADGRAARTARTALTALVTLGTLAACDGTSELEGVLGPSALTSGSGSVGVGTGVLQRGAAELLGSWTRIAGGPGVVVEQSYTFAGDGTGVRTTTTRTALGVPIAAEAAPFTWSGGAGVLRLEFRRNGAVEAVLRTSYQVLLDLGGTTLRLDGLTFARTGG